VRPGREDRRVALAGDDGLQDVAGRLVPGQRVHRGRQLDQGAVQQLLQPLPLPRPVADQLQPCAGQVPQRPATAILEAEGDLEGLAEAWLCTGMTRFWLGDSPVGEHAFERAMASPGNPVIAACRYRPEGGSP